MNRRLEIGDLGDNLEEQSKFLLNAHDSKNSSGCVVSVAHWREAPSAHNRESAVIGNNLIEGTFHPVDLLLHYLDDLLDNLKRLSRFEVLFDLHVHHNDGDSSMLVAESILLEL